MRTVQVFMNGVLAGEFISFSRESYQFCYQKEYQGLPISLDMPISKSVYEFNQFPAFFEGLLPEGAQLEALLKKYKLDKRDYFSQLVQVGEDLVGAVTIKEVKVK